MDENQVRSIVREEIKSAAQKAQYSVTRVPVHIHNNIDSPNIPQHSVVGFQTLDGVAGGVAYPSLLNGQALSFGDTTDTSTTVPNVNIYPLPIIYGYGTTSGSVTLYLSQTTTGALSMGATSATLTVKWPYTSTTHDVLFSNGDTKTVTFTNNSTALSWTGGLSSGATTALLVLFLPSGAISAKLSSNFGGTTGGYAIQFSNDEIRVVAFTNGSSNVTWSPALQEDATSTTTQINNARFHGGTAPNGTALVFRNDDDGILQLWVRTAPGIFTDTWASVDLTLSITD